MCGIAGLIDASLSAEERRAIVGRMCDAMVHRGPDDQGVEARDFATLGSRRLAIFDPANGHQPMHTPDGRFTIVLNGAIYNFRELRTELASSGWSFRTNCDTEVLLVACAAWGVQGCLGRLRGMFAFALWDDREKVLQLARDPFGIKPLYYRQDGERLLFASEINALRASGVFQAEVDPLSVADTLAWLAVPAPRTIFRDVFSLRPGEAAIFTRGRFEIRSAWNFHSIPSPGSPCRSRREFTEELRARLEDTARAHVLADVPVGAFLSGGLDSAVVAGLMTRAAGGKLRTFSIGFEEAAYSEVSEAEATARHFGAEHQSRIITGAEVARDIENFAASCDQPTGDGLNTYYASQTARAGGVTVALSGLGGDELFGGYPSFRDIPRLAAWLPWWRALPSSLRAVILARLRRGSARRRKLADILEFARTVPEVSSMYRRVFSEQGRRALLGPAALIALGDRSPFHSELAALRRDLAGCGDFECISGWELHTYMADVLLRDSDAMSMRHSLELRVPFVDRVLVEWLWRQPPAFKLTPRHPKGALAEAVADLLPPGMRHRRKQGFTLPLALWMRRELKPFLEETFSSRSIERSGLFNRSAVQGSWNRFLRRNDAPEWTRLWSLAMTITFVNRSTPAAARAGMNEVRGGSREVEVEKPSGSRSVPPPSRLPQQASPKDPPAPLKEARPPEKGAAYQGTTLFITPEIFASVGGITRILQLYLKSLSDIGAGRQRGVRLLALNDTAMDSRDTRRCAGPNLTNWFVCGGDKRRFVRQALRMSKGCDTLVCGHVAQLPVAWAARCLHPKLRYYLIAHGIEVWRPFTLAERIALRGAARIFCVSDYTRRELGKRCRLRPGQAVVLPNALDTTTFPIAPGKPLAECPPVILTVSRLSHADRYKGIEHLIAAMPAIRAAEPGAQLRIIGGGDDLPRLQSVARERSALGSEIVFLGPVDDKVLAAEMRSCRLFALPSTREGFGIVFLEAMANGRPCVGARAGGVPEVITEGTGVLVEPDSVPAIAGGCIEALRRNWQEETILDHARKFSYEAFRERLGELLAK
jgi:asparagine synthase (glutamine-hydrolysing)